LILGASTLLFSAGLGKTHGTPLPPIRKRVESPGPTDLGSDLSAIFDGPRAVRTSGTRTLNCTPSLPSCDKTARIVI